MLFSGIGGCGTGEMLRPAWQHGLSYELYSLYIRLDKDGRLQPVLCFLFTFAALELLKGTAGAAGWGLGDDGSLDEATLDDDGSAFVKNLRRGITLIQVLGTVAACVWIAANMLRYMREEQPQRAQELLIKSAVGLASINGMLFFVNFMMGAMTD